ncbi:MFS transporter [Sphingomonas sp. LB-2]|uniref:MFS transporter n=1 Tax=Sphingomonas caeni TaxID=2984949 RepID=UPI00222FC04C|nr:MFS transporter [Sphingomonas caeni]MCW3848615.1 MFS transporter [Sphingomonas caeni]
MGRDPQAILDAEPMSRAQWATVAVMVGLNALDGFDVLSISFASPGIAKAWGIDRAALGLVLSMELIGMALGSLTLGGVADRVGRRATILMCLVVMAAGMTGAATAANVEILSGWRLLTGLGIGGMLAATNAAVAEAANARHRSLCVVLMAAGYPVGTIVGGSIAAVLLGHYGWQSVFAFGAIATALFIPLVLLAAPESISFLMHRRPKNALERINRLLARMGHAPAETLPDVATAQRSVPVAALFSSAHARTTIVLTAAYLAHIMTFYFILKWIPKIVVDMGYAPSAAAGVLVAASAGGATGSLLLGLLTARVRLLALTVVAMVASVALVTLFGRGGSDLASLSNMLLGIEISKLASLSMVAAAAGFATNAGVVGLYALLARGFPTGLRATATGFVIGVGRGGSALAPALAGLLFAAGYSLSLVAILMSLGSAVAAIALLALRNRPVEAH